MTSVLLYNLYAKTNWKAVTTNLISNVPHDTVIIHVSLPWYALPSKYSIQKFLCRFEKVSRIVFSINRKKRGETIGFKKFQAMALQQYDIVTYIHSKGTSKKSKHNKAIQDWTALMHYFVVERLDLCKAAFEKGHLLYGVNLSTHIAAGVKEQIPLAHFHYSGNFVSFNNKILGEKFATTPCGNSYYGVEFFWGQLCPIHLAYNAHTSNVNHYNETYPPEKYREQGHIA
jgi:hypothetical protein